VPKNTPDLPRVPVSGRDPIMNTKQLAAYLGCSAATCLRWRREGTGPEYVAVSARQIRYRNSAVESFLSQRERQSNAA
jgi:predicted DNA-binding transcriptional regulator AlpA